MTEAEKDMVAAADAAVKAASARSADDALGRTQIWLGAMFCAMPAAQRAQTIALLREWGEP